MPVDVGSTRQSMRHWARSAGPYLYVVPTLLILGLFIYWPILYSGYLSLHRWDFMLPTKPFVGLDNYEALVTSSQFWNSLSVTLVFVVGSVPIRLALALLLAHLIADNSPLSRSLRTVYFVPVVASTAAVAIVWSWLFNTDLGLINQVITWLGGPKVSWLFDIDVAIWSLVIVNVWKQLGYDVVIYLAGLQAIPRTYFEASAIDGAGRWHRFRTITVPLLMPTTLFLLVVSVIDSFQVFTLINVMTSGGPANSTDVVINYLYQTAFVFFDIGKGSALAMILFAILIGLTALKFGVLGRRVTYDHG